VFGTLPDPGRAHDKLLSYPRPILGHVFGTAESIEGSGGFRLPELALSRQAIDFTSCSVAQQPSSGTRSSLMLTEAAVRDRLRHEVLATVGVPSHAAYEFWLPETNARADVAVIATALQGFEIKTERDTLKRLPRQAIAYGRLFDRCTVVLAERHLDAALGMLPDWWGVVTIQPDPDAAFRTVRPPQLNIGVDPEILVRLLWKEEVNALLCGLGAEPDREGGRSAMWRQLLTLADLESLKLAVCQALLRRNSAGGRHPAARRLSSAKVMG
jgi:hypothetical protein